MTDCPGCDEDEKEFDHYHQYINILGNTNQIWFIEGQKFQSEHSAAMYINKELGFPLKDCLIYTSSIPKKYN